jgi:hypothetical protein
MAPADAVSAVPDRFEADLPQPVESQLPDPSLRFIMQPAVLRSARGLSWVLKGLSVQDARIVLEAGLAQLLASRARRNGLATGDDVVGVQDGRVVIMQVKDGRAGPAAGVPAVPRLPDGAPGGGGRARSSEPVAV